MDAQIAEWLNLLKVTLSAKTLQNYEYHLRQLAKAAPGRQAQDWTRADLLAHIGAKREAGNGDAILKQMVGALKSFFRYHLADASPMKDVPYPKVKRRIQRTLDAEQALRVMAACDTSTPKGVRDLAIIALMLDTGLRNSEVCRARVADMNLEKRRLKVVVKGGDEETAVFSRTTAAHLARWLAIRSAYARPNCETIFITFWGRAVGMAMSAEGLRTLFENIGKRAGLERFTPHDLRRTFATIAIRNGAPTRVVQAAGRWGDVSMVERYTQAIQAEDFDRYSPVEALLKGNEE